MGWRIGSMSNMEMSFPAINMSAGTVTLSLWVAGGIAALLLLFLLLAIFRSGSAAVVWTLVRAALIVIVVLLAWALLDRLADRDRTDERHALDQRLDELAAHASAPGSALGCLDGGISEPLESACEKAIFAGPETIAAAMSYVGSRISLLADAADYVSRTDPSYATSIAGLRRSLEADRFGLVAQNLAARHGCTAAKCGLFVLFADTTKVATNLRDRTFDGLIGRYAAVWPSRGGPTAGQAVVPPATQSAAPTSEPAQVPATSAAAEPATAPPAVTPPVPPRRPATRAQAPRRPASPPPSPPPPPPVPIGPPAASAGAPPPPQ